MKRFLLGILLVCPLLTRSQLLHPDQLRADLAYVRTALAEAHPAPYRYTPKARFDSLFSAVAARLDHSMTQHELYVAMTPLLVALRDGHIKWMLPGRDEHYPFYTDRLFPLKLYVLGERAWVVGSYGGDTLSAGAELLTINDQPTADVIRKLLSNMTFGDGTTVTGKHEDLNQFFSGFYATYVGAPAMHTITIQIGDSTRTLQLPAVDLAAINAYNERHKPAIRPVHRIAIDDSTHTATVTIERFWTQNQELAFRAFLAQAFRQIRERKVQHLILDLRNNEGGEEKYGIRLYRYLARHPFRYYDHISVRRKKSFSFPAWTPALYRRLRWLVLRKRGDTYELTKQSGLKSWNPRRDAYAGALYVLINGRSFSVTTEFTARVHADRRATFVGQETGGAYEGNNSGIFAVTQLPNAKIDLGIPLFGFFMANLPAGLQPGQGIRPDHWVTPTLDDVLTNNDRVMQHARQLIQTGNQSPARTTSANE